MPEQPRVMFEGPPIWPPHGQQVQVEEQESPLALLLEALQPPPLAPARHGGVGGEPPAPPPPSPMAGPRGGRGA
jgi:hypothetical protein